VRPCDRRPRELPGRKPGRERQRADNDGDAASLPDWLRARLHSGRTFHFTRTGARWGTIEQYRAEKVRGDVFRWRHHTGEKVFK